MYSPALAPPRTSHRPAASLYQQVSTDSGALSASPHQLVTMLFDGLLQALNQARGALARKDIAAKAGAIDRAVRILNEGLKEGLVGLGSNELADNAFMLYSYITVRLTQANLHKDDAALQECQRLIEPLRDAWIAIRPQVEHAPN